MKSPHSFRVSPLWLALPMLLAAALAAAGGYHLIKTISIPGDYGWDYLTADSDGRRLYVSHDKEVVVIDLDSGAIVGTVPAVTFTASRWYGTWDVDSSVRRTLVR